MLTFLVVTVQSGWLPYAIFLIFSFAGFLYFQHVSLQALASSCAIKHSIGQSQLRPSDRLLGKTQRQAETTSVLLIAGPQPTELLAGHSLLNKLHWHSGTVTASLRILGSIWSLLYQQPLLHQLLEAPGGTASSALKISPECCRAALFSLGWKNIRPLYHAWVSLLLENTMSTSLFLLGFPSEHKNPLFTNRYYSGRLSLPLHWYWDDLIPEVLCSQMMLVGEGWQLWNI